MRGQGICQSPVEDLPGGGGHKVSLDSFKRSAHHENRTYCLSCGQSANQVYQLCTKLNWDVEGLFPKSSVKFHARVLLPNPQVLEELRCS